MRGLSEGSVIRNADVLSRLVDAAGGWKFFSTVTGYPVRTVNTWRTGERTPAAPAAFTLLLVAAVRKEIDPARFNKIIDEITDVM